MTNPQDPNQLKGANDVGTQIPTQVPTPDNGATAANIDPLTTNVNEVKSTDDNVGTIGGGSTVGTDPTLVDTGIAPADAGVPGTPPADAGTGTSDTGASGAGSTASTDSAAATGVAVTGTTPAAAGGTDTSGTGSGGAGAPAVGEGDVDTQNQADDANAGTGANDSGDAGADSTDAGNTPADGGDSSSVDPSNGSDSGDGQDSGSDPAQPPQGADLTILSNMLDLLNGANVDYKQSEQLATGEVGFPVWITQATFDNFVEFDPSFASLLNKQVMIATDGFAGLGLDPTVEAVLEVPTPGASISDVLNWLNKIDLPFSVQTFVFEPAGSITLSAADFAIAVQADPALQTFVDSGQLIIEADENSNVAGNASQADVSQDATDSTSGDPANDQGDGDGAQIDDTGAAAGQDPVAGGQDGGSDALPDVAANQPVVGAGSAETGGVAGTVPADPGNTPGSDAGTQDPGSAGTTSPAVPVTPPVVIPTTVAGDTGRACTDSTVNQIVNLILQDVSKMSRDVVEEIYAFIGKMRPGKPLTKEEAVRNHVALWGTLKRLFGNQDVDFHQTMPAVLKIFEAHSSGVFGIKHRLRFIELAHSMTADDRNAYQHMLHLLVTTAPVRGRKQALQQIDLKKAVGNPKHVPEAGQQRTRAFYEQQR